MKRGSLTIKGMLQNEFSLKEYRGTDGAIIPKSNRLLQLKKGSALNRKLVMEKSVFNMVVTKKGKN